MRRSSAYLLQFVHSHRPTKSKPLPKMRCETFALEKGAFGVWVKPCKHCWVFLRCPASGRARVQCCSLRRISIRVLTVVLAIERKLRPLQKVEKPFFEAVNQFASVYPPP